VPGPGDATPTVDAETLRYLSRILGRQPEVQATSLSPANRQESLVVVLEDEYYRDAVDEARLEVRAYTNGDFHVSYVESYLGEPRRCRWDRHDQDHNSRDHVHPFPDAGTSGAEDRDFPTDLTALLEQVVLPWVEARLGEIWEE
jgi:hypothetical protein